jgi:hypothetical protein
MRPDSLDLIVLIYNAAQDALPGLMEQLPTSYAKLSWLSARVREAEADVARMVEDSIATGRGATDSKPWDDLQY